MPIRAVVYVSEASDALRGDLLGLRSGKLQELVDDATRFNRDAGVSGVLLFDGTRFLQYMEGPPDGLDVVFSRVLGASSHHDLIELQRGTITDRRLPYWPMRWLPVEVQELSEVAEGDWAGFKVRGDGSVERNRDRPFNVPSEQARTGRKVNQWRPPGSARNPTPTCSPSLRGSP